MASQSFFMRLRAAKGYIKVCHTIEVNAVHISIFDKFPALNFSTQDLATVAIFSICCFLFSSGTISTPSVSSALSTSEHWWM